MTDNKQALIEKHREFNVFDDWCDCVYDHFTEDMKAKHIEVDKMQFTGFWSQGDGASFTGHITDNKAFFEEHKLTESYPWITKLMSMGGAFSLLIERTSHRYVHENSVSVELMHTDMFSNVISQSGLRGAIAEQWDTQLDAEYCTIADAVTDIIRGYCRDLYQRLETEYEYLTSDDAVWDAIVANDLDKVDEEEEA